MVKHTELNVDNKNNVYYEALEKIYKAANNVETAGNAKLALQHIKEIIDETI